MNNKLLKFYKWPRECPMIAKILKINYDKNFMSLIVKKKLKK